MNRKERRKQEKAQARHQEKTISPFTKLCESFASEYLNGTLDSDFDPDSLVQKYENMWRLMADKIIKVDAVTFNNPQKKLQSQKNRENLVNAFKVFAIKYREKLG